MTRALSALERQLGYHFHDASLAVQALTHRSAGADNNERLEFLGDAVLGFVVAEALYRAAPTAREGDLTRVRARLVRQQSLAEVARSLSLGTHIILGSGEDKSGGRERDSILADALEALFGAIMIDGGISAAEGAVTGIFDPWIKELLVIGVEKDSKTRLQEHVQSLGLGLPAYEIVAVEGLSHQQDFRVQCCVDALDVSETGAGPSRRRAEQSAASAVLSSLGVE